VLLFAVKYKFIVELSLWLNTTNSPALSGLLHLIKHLSNFYKLFHVLSMGSPVALRTSWINSINNCRGAAILR